MKLAIWRLVEMLETKAVGQVREAHIITDRPGKWWPQGVNAPTGKLMIFLHLDWDLWLGPAKESQALQSRLCSI